MHGFTLFAIYLLIERQGCGRDGYRFGKLGNQWKVLCDRDRMIRAADNHSFQADVVRIGSFLTEPVARVTIQEALFDE
jgi:hypothetical protein